MTRATVRDARHVLWDSIAEERELPPKEIREGFLEEAASELALARRIWTW